MSEKQNQLSGVPIMDVRAELITLLPRLRRFAFCLTRSLQDADDLVQSACERALTRIEQFQPGSRLDSWMFAIMRNLWIDRIRARARAPEVADSALVEAIADSDRISERTEARSDLRSISQLMLQLPEGQLSVLTLVAVEGHSYQEAAEMLQVPIGTIMSRLSRARAKLAAGLSEPDRIPATKVTGE